VVRKLCFVPKSLDIEQRRANRRRWFLGPSPKIARCQFVYSNKPLFRLIVDSAAQGTWVRSWYRPRDDHRFHAAERRRRTWCALSPVARPRDAGRAFRSLQCPNRNLDCV